MRLCHHCGELFDAPNWRCRDCGQDVSVIAGFPALAPGAAESEGGFKVEYFQQLAELEDDHFWFKSRSRLVVSVLQHYFPDVQRYLEIGCGTGHMLRAVASQNEQAEITGSEIFSEGLEFSQRRVPRAELQQMDARAIPYSDHFDLIGAFDVLEHIVEDRIVLAEVYKALRPSGGLLLTVPQHLWLWSLQDEYACHVRRYTRKDLTTKLQTEGFNIVWTTSFVSLLLPVLWLSRKCMKPEQNLDAFAELRINRVVNAIFSGVMTIEHYFVKMGLRFPFGGSLLVVARKTSERNDSV